MVENVVNELEQVERMLVPRVDVSDLPLDDDPPLGSFSNVPKVDTPNDDVLAKETSTAEGETADNGNSCDHPAISVASLIKRSCEVSERRSSQKSKGEKNGALEGSNPGQRNRKKQKRRWADVGNKTSLHKTSLHKTPLHKTPLQLLNEVFSLSPDEVRFVEDHSFGSGNHSSDVSLFRMKCIVKGTSFYGSGRNKQMARHAAAKAALDHYLLEERRCGGERGAAAPTPGLIAPPLGHRYNVPSAPFFRDYYIGPEPMYGPRQRPPPPPPGHYGNYPPGAGQFEFAPPPPSYYPSEVSPYYHSDAYHHRDPYEYQRPPPPRYPPPRLSWPPPPAGPFGDGYHPYPELMPQRPSVPSRRPFEDYAPGYTPSDTLPIEAPMLPVENPSAHAPSQVRFPMISDDYEPPPSKRPSLPLQKRSNPNTNFAEDDIDDFVTFDAITDEPKDGERDLIYHKNVPKGKEKILLKVTAIRSGTESETDMDNLVSNHPVSLIHDLHPDLTWDFVGTESVGKQITCFKMNLLIHGQVFEGSGKTKKLAKYNAAKTALCDLYNILIPDPPTQSQLKKMKDALQELETHQFGANPIIPPSLGAQGVVFKPPPVIRVKTDEALLLEQDLADRIGLAVLEKSKQVIETLPDTKKWNVLASIVLSSGRDGTFLKVVCVTSGTKCVKGDALSLSGSSVNDCHAEILARRCFISFLYQQLNSLVDSGFKDDPSFVIQRCEDSFGFRMKDDIRVHLFISTAPCGDGRVFSPKEEEPSDAHPNRLSRGVLRAKIEGGEGTIPVRKEGSLLTWDGVLQGNQRMQFMSCSDKISSWNVLGLQGSLLSHLFKPIYLHSVILANLFSFEHLVRALHARLNLNFESSSLKTLPTFYELRKTKVAKASLSVKEVQRQLTKTPNYAVNWIDGQDGAEVISCDTGKLYKEGAPSRLSKKTFFHSFTRLLSKNVPTLASSPLRESIPIVYRDAKTAATDYQRAKNQVIQAFLEQGLGSWIQVPAEIDLFGL